MKSKLFLIIFLFSLLEGNTQDIAGWQSKARQFQKQNDYNNAILVLQQGLQSVPGNVVLSKELAICWNAVGDNEQALLTIKPVLQQADADDQCYQVAGKILKDLRRMKDCEKHYKKGIKRFPNSGALYNELGELLWMQQDYGAINFWEKGIEKDPAYSRNYYNAARYYYLTTNKVWALLYGEIFVNMEPLSTQVPEMKDILLESYKKLFSSMVTKRLTREKTAFARNYLSCMQSQAEVTSEGINLESLLMLRTRFIIEWSYRYKEKFPYKLFDYQQQLLQEGHYEAYHQWLFGSAFNLVQFQQWTVLHAREYQSFLNFHQARLFKMPEGQGQH